MTADARRTSPPLCWKLVTELAELDDAQRIRLQCFRDELGIPIDSPVGRDVSDYDCLGTTFHVIVLRGRRIIGTARLCLPNAEVARSSRTVLGLEMGRKFDLQPLAALSNELAEVARVCIPQHHRGAGRAAEKLYEALFTISQQLGIRYWTGAVDCQTSRSRDAAIMHAILDSRGLVLDAIRVNPLPAQPVSVASQPVAGAGRAFYTAEELARAAHGELSGLSISSPLSAFSTRLGARCIGAPAVHPAYPRWVMPMLVDLQQLPRETLSKFDATLLAPTIRRRLRP